MKKRVALLAPMAAVAITFAACGSSGPVRSGSGTPGPRSVAPATVAPPTTTAPTASSATTAPAGSALSSALDQAATLEGTTLATYQAVVAQLGAVAPFVNVASSEQQHLSAVQTVASHYGLTVPTSGFSAPAVPSTRTAACQLGVTTEQHVMATYDTLIPQVSAYPDVAQVFTTLRQAAEESHLPAFEHCS